MTNNINTTIEQNGLRSHEILNPKLRFFEIIPQKCKEIRKSWKRIEKKQN